MFAGPAHVCLVSCFCFGIGKVFSANLSSPISTIRLDAKRQGDLGRVF